MRRKRYELKAKDFLQSSIFATAFVKEPAIEVDFIYLSEEGSEKSIIKLKYEDEKGIVYSPVLIPEQTILRKDKNGEEFEIYFSAETIEELSERYMKAKSPMGNWNSEHNEHQKLEGVNVIENWIVGDDNRAEKLGFNVPKGTWMQAIKVDSEEIRTKLKNGTYKGISIEGDFEHIQRLTAINNVTSIEMEKKESTIDKLLTKLESIVKGTTKLGSMPLDGEGAIYFEGDGISEGAMIYIDEAMEVKAPAGPHTLQDGKIVTVDEAGMVVKVEEKEVVEETEDLSADLEKVAEATVKTAESVEALRKENAELKTQLGETKTSLTKLTELVESHKTLLAKVSQEAPTSTTKLSTMAPESRASQVLARRVNF